MIRAAVLADLPAIAAMVAPSVRQMRAAGNDQWSEEYPSEADFRADILAEALYVAADDADSARLYGVVCLNRDEPPQYADIAWAHPGPALVIHRLAVDPAARGRGVGASLFAWAEALARGRGMGSLRSDTYSRNPAMNALFAKMGFRRAGDMRFPGRAHDFHCWEKVLTPVAARQ